MSTEIRTVLLIVFFCLTNAQEIPYELTSVEDFDLPDAAIDYRLPNNTKPLEYNISLYTRVDLKVFQFAGIVKIKILVVEKSRIISLQQRELVIRFAELRNATAKIDILPLGYDNRTELLNVVTEKVDLQPGEVYTLTISYTGVLNFDEVGFRREFYLNAKGRQSWLAMTHFESSNARRAFPCYDEPAFKANFTISITHGSSYHAISNMPGAKSQK